MDELVPPPAPVVVMPVPPEQSRTLRLTKWLSWWCAPLLAFLPDMVGMLLHLWMTDDAFADAVMGIVPREYRVAMATIIWVIARRYGQLRRDTAAPIAGTPLAESLPVATTPAHDAPAKR